MPDRVVLFIAAFTVWIACYIVALTFPMLNDSPAVRPAMTFWIYAAVSLGSFFFLLLLIPETKGCTQEEIGRMWFPAEPAAGKGSAS